MNTTNCRRCVSGTLADDGAHGALRDTLTLYGEEYRLSCRRLVLGRVA